MKLSRFYLTARISRSFMAVSTATSTMVRQYSLELSRNFRSCSGDGNSRDERDALDDVI